LEVAPLKVDSAVVLTASFPWLRSTKGFKAWPPDSPVVFGVYELLAGAVPGG
jgi:hypothetical protein